MAIVVGDRRYVTLGDELQVNGKKVLEAYANGVKVYPERSVHLDGNPYVVKFCGSATFSFSPLNPCSCSGSAGTRQCWFTLSAAYSVVLAIYTDSVVPAVLGVTYPASERMYGRKAILHGKISKTLVLDMTVNLSSTNWSIKSPVDYYSFPSHETRWFTPAGFTSRFNGTHHGGSFDNVVSEGVLLDISSKDLALPIPDRLVTSHAIEDPRIIEAVRESPSLRDYLIQYVSAENLHAKFRRMVGETGSRQGYIHGVSVETTDVIHTFSREVVVWEMFGAGWNVFETTPMSIPIDEIVYCGLASDLESKYDFTTSVRDLKYFG